MFSPLQKASSDSYVIAEVGQNHQGSLSEALRYISVFAGLGADAVKFQIRNNRYLFDREYYSSRYDSENSFGDTYGEHREALELSSLELKAICDRARNYDVDIIITPFDEPSLELCIELGVNAIKIASFDLGNIPFLERIASTGLPIVMSTGGGTIEQINDSVVAIQKYHNDLSLLHCVSKYPCSAHEVQLDKINVLANHFPSVTLGLSDHFNGILTGPLAYLVGARVFEKHVTFDRSQKGTDHAFSLEPEGFRKFVRDIRRTPIIMNCNSYEELGNEPVFLKLGKSIISLTNINKGEIIKSDHLSGRICRPSVIPVRESSKVLGSRANQFIPAGSYISYEMISQ
jgi:sialic acid synthase